MRFARWVFLISGIYGVLVLAPQYFLEQRLSRDYPPALTHPELYYGFIGTALAFQVLFPRAGTYRLWVQFQRHGRVLTAPFTVSAAVAPAGGRH